MAIKAVVFDLDNTLYDEKEYYRLAIENFAEEFGLEKKDMLEVLPVAYESGGDILGRILSMAGLDISWQERFFQTYCDVKGDLRVRDEVRDVLKRIRDAGKKLFLLTNGVVRAQKRKVELLGLEALFDDVVFARERGREKPECDGLLYLGNKWKIAMEEMMVVGDDVRLDGGLCKCGAVVCLVERVYMRPEVILEVMGING